MALLVRNATVIPMEPAGSVVRDGWVLVEPPLIAALGTGPPPPSTPGDRVIDAHGGLVVPGFVSAHQHLLDVLLRGGLPHGLAFLDWLLGLYYAGMAAYTPEDAGLATTLAIAETLAAGVTCIVDNWGVDNGSDPERVRACAEVLDDGEIVVLDPDQRVRLYRDAQVASERIACQAGLGPGMGPG
jgi:5-methylthioadenosine/S-adenosylhomocysteine deaminase